MSRTEAGKRVDSAAALIEKILAIALIAGICLNFINVCGRYLADLSIGGSDEIEIYILIWIAFLGGAVVSWRGQHLRMDVLLESARPSVRRLVNVAEVIVTGVVAAFVAYQSFFYVLRIYTLGAVSDIARLPTWIPHSAVPLGLTLMVVALVLRAWLKWRPAQEEMQ
jgi:TRAP-type C4-dicarboxylate transport system permease small subunit